MKRIKNLKARVIFSALVIMCGGGLSENANANNCNAVASGNWTTPSTWNFCSGGAPLTTDSVDVGTFGYVDVTSTGSTSRSAYTHVSNMAIIDNLGTFTNNDSFVVINKGQFINDGNFFNSIGDANNGFNPSAVSLVNVSGHIDNGGTMTNVAGMIDNTQGTTFYNFGTINNSGSFTNAGDLENFNGAQLIVSQQLIPLSGGATSTGSLINTGGTFRNDGTVTVTSPSTFTLAGGEFGGRGTVNGNISNITGHLGIKGSLDNETINGNLSFAPGGIYGVDLGASGHDMFTVNGSVTGLAFNDLFVNFVDTTGFNTNTSFIVMSATGGFGGLAGGQLLWTDLNGWQITAEILGASGSTEYLNLYLHCSSADCNNSVGPAVPAGFSDAGGNGVGTPTPESSALGILGLGLVALVFRRKSKA